MIQLCNSNKPISNKDISELESQIGISLPNTMKELYLLYNGGQPSPSYVHDKKHLYHVNAFDSISEIIENIKYHDIDVIPKGFKPNELLIFAYDDFGNEFALDISSKAFGKVYFYVAEDDYNIYGEWENFNIFLECFTDEGEDKD